MRADIMSDVRPYLFLAAIGVLMWAMRSAAGRLAPRVAVGTIFFLLSRKPVLAAWAVGAVGMLVPLAGGAVAHGRTTLADYAFMSGLSAFCGLGFAALAVGPAWMAIRAFARAPVLDLQAGEMPLRELAANHFLGGEGRGGKVVVTTRRLAFRPHRFNVQVTTWSARLEDLGEMRPEGNRFLVLHVAGQTAPEWFVVWRPDRFAEYLQALAARPEAERVQADAEASKALSLPPRGLASVADEIVPLP
jgi:hypothetical protein